MSALDDFDPDEAKIAEQERRFYDCGICDGAHREDDCPYAAVDGSGTQQRAKTKARSELAGSPSNNKDLRTLCHDMLLVNPAFLETTDIDKHVAKIEAQYISKQSVLEAIGEDEVWNGYGPTESLKLRGAGIVRNEFRANLKDALGLNNPSKDSNNG